MHIIRTIFKGLILSFFLVVLSHVATAQIKNITVNKKQVTIREMFDEIEEQTDFNVAYKKSDIDKRRRMDVSFQKESVEHVLDVVLQNTGLLYKIKGNYIVIYQPKDKRKAKVLTQTIRGMVYNMETGSPVAFANIALLEDVTKGAISDSEGRFSIENVPLGYTNLKVSFVGFETYIYREILLTSGKEAMVKIPLQPKSQLVDEVIVRPQVNKERTVNPMALTEGRMLSVEESNRFAGAFNDPARLVTSFAGVSGTGGISSNALSIRGNAPQYTQWRLEGVEIPNPTHFADMVSLGGGVYSALSSKVMGNSDFFNGAFPAMYSNALSGAFDMRMRTGNISNPQHALQVSLMGIDFGSEGPLSKNSNSSYIFNYRYSVTGLVADVNLNYQDLSFKLNFPTQKAGTFSLWGLGLTDRNSAGPLEKEDWETAADRQDVNTTLEKGSGGITHQYIVNNTTYIKTVLAGTYSGILQDVSQVDSFANHAQVVDITNQNWNLVLNSYLNKRFSSRHINRSGVTVTGMNYNLNYNVTPNYGLDLPMKEIARGSGDNLQVSAYSHSIFALTPTFSLSAGLNAQYFNLNGNFHLEPRMSVKWDFVPGQALSAAYGLNSRRERLDFYYVVNPSTNLPGNKNLDMAKAHHFNLGYDLHISDILRLKVEPYFQYLFDVPVEPNSSFSVLNLNDYYLDKVLVNEGLGRNYGLDVTLEHYLHNGTYYLLTGSVFKSEYRGGDKVWRSTRYNRGYSFNGVWGKEWRTGRGQNNSFGLNLRFTCQGGERYTAINRELSIANHEIAFDNSKAFSKQYAPFIGGDISINYRINREKLSHEIALKGLNIGLYTGQSGYFYNEATNAIEKVDLMGTLWDISYKISF